MTMQLLENVEKAIEFHEKAIEHLRAYRNTLQQMQCSFEEALNGTVSTKKSVATKRVATKRVASSSDDNDISLREAVWGVVSRKEYTKEGIRVASIISIIKEEDIWTTGGDLANMVHVAVYKLKKEGKLVRGDNKCYKIANGANLD